MFVENDLAQESRPSWSAYTVHQGQQLDSSLVVSASQVDLAVPLLASVKAGSKAEPNEATDLEDLLPQHEFGQPGLYPAAQEEGICSPARMLANMLIGFLQATVIGVPFVFRSGGYVLSTAVFAATGLLSLHSMLMIVQCRQRLAGRGISDLSGVVHACLGPWGRRANDVLVIASQAGLCASYLVFMGSNLAPLFALPSYAVILAAAPLLLGLAMVKHVGSLAPVSAFANSINLVGVAIVFSSVFKAFGRPHAPAVPMGSPASLPFLFGFANSLFTGVGVVLPFERSMREPAKFPGAVSLGMVLVTVITCAIGLCGYLAFGADTGELLTLNVPRNGATVAAQIMLSASMCSPFAVMMTPCWEMLQAWLCGKAWFGGVRHRWAATRAARTVCVGALLAVACLTPSFAIFMAFVGALTCGTISFVIPGLCHLALFWRQLPWYHAAYDALMVTLGLVGAVLGTRDAVAASLLLAAGGSP